MSLVYKYYYTRYYLYTEDYINSLVEQQWNTPIHRQSTRGNTSFKKNLHHSSSSHLQLMSSVTGRVSRLMVVIQQV
jgi:hypothetical protein